MDSTLSFSGGTWSVACFDKGRSCSTQQDAITIAIGLATTTKQPALISWFGVEDGEAMILPWGVVSVKGNLIFLNKTQLKQAR
jgi:hypothetical protein